jgi:hypothetical protein
MAFRAENATLRTLIFATYGSEFQNFQIVGGPPRIDADYLDVDARADRDLEVDFTRDHLLTASRGDGAAPLPPDAVSAFTAFQEQLGLRLETQRQPVEVLIITGATLPDAN